MKRVQQPTETELQQDWQRQTGTVRLRVRIGMNTGYCTVGNFGSNNLMEYTAVGKGVNLASRLETSCTPGSIKVSYPVYLLTKDNFDYAEPHEEYFKGFLRKIKVCELKPF